MRDRKRLSKSTFACTLSIGLLSLSLPASANSLKLDIEPGLWQHSFSIKTASGELERAMQQLEQQLASMPAAQRQMMESMMASHVF